MTEIKESKYTCGEISGTLRDTGSDTICLMVHGFGCSPHDRLFRNYAKELSIKGTTTLRINLYSEKSLHTVRLGDHITAIQSVVTDISQTHEKILIIGHSLGGMLSFKLSDPKIIAIIAWDPAVVGKEYWNISNSFKGLGKYGFKSLFPVTTLVSENLYDDLLSMPTDYICGTDHSYLIVCCEQVGTYNHRINFDYGENQYLKLIPGSGHFFQERGAEEELFAISDEFIAGVLGE